MRIVGARKFERMLRNLPKKTREPIFDAIEQGVGEITDLQKSLVPVDTGDLKNSFEQKRFTKTDTQATFGVRWWVSDFKGHFVEYGVTGGSKIIQVRGRKGKKYRKTITWASQGARPFFWPGYWVLRTRVTARVFRVMKKTLKKEFKI
ncbi:MAG: HK97 gp10 family phage protein [Alphaproteobacteria bacterium]|nr:HK97 gp10 family phage protein [Alphaproteobacteria bacterium]